MPGVSGDNFLLLLISELFMFFTDVRGVAFVIVLFIVTIIAVAVYFVRLDVAEDARLGGQ